MNTPIYRDGLPQNLESAALDALEWLIVFERLMTSGRLSSLYAEIPENSKRIKACIQELQKRGIGMIEPSYLFPEKEEKFDVFPGHKNRIKD